MDFLGSPDDLGKGRTNYGGKDGLRYAKAAISAGYDVTIIRRKDMEEMIGCGISTLYRHHVREGLRGCHDLILSLSDSP